MKLATQQDAVGSKESEKKKTHGVDNNRLGFATGSGGAHAHSRSICISYIYIFVSVAVCVAPASSFINAYTCNGCVCVCESVFISTLQVVQQSQNRHGTARDEMGRALQVSLGSLCHRFRSPCCLLIFVSLRIAS